MENYFDVFDSFRVMLCVFLDLINLKRYRCIDRKTRDILTRNALCYPKNDKGYDMAHCEKRLDFGNQTIRNHFARMDFPEFDIAGIFDRRISNRMLAVKIIELTKDISFSITYPFAEPDIDDTNWDMRFEIISIADEHSGFWRFRFSADDGAMVRKIFLDKLPHYYTMVKLFKMLDAVPRIHSSSGNVPNREYIKLVRCNDKPHYVSIMKVFGYALNLTL